MKLSYLALAAWAAATVHSPALADRPPSAHIRCDGNPDNITSGETAARVLGAIALIGLFVPPHETADSAMRRSGREGIAVCNEALDGESNDVRRAELILARAIHQMEVEDFPAAIADARAALTDRPALAGTPAFRLSLQLSALEIEAMALIAQGRNQEAAAKAMEMAAAAPYDAVALLRASRYVRALGSFGPAEQQFYERLVRIYPAALIDRAWVREMAGDFAGAADDYELWSALHQTMFAERRDPSALARAALARAIAGQTERAAELAGQAREAIGPDTPEISTTSANEVLDLYQILETARQGRIADARLVFTGRTSWTRPHPAMRAEVMRILRHGAEPQQLTGNLAQDPQSVRDAALTEQIERLKDPKERFQAIRAYAGPSQFDRFARNTWRTERSRYLGNENEELSATFINTQRDGFGMPSGYALLLHSALVARSRGNSDFMLLPGQRTISSHFVRFGTSGEEGLPAPFTLNAEQVIADLTPLIPTPARRR